jgi:tropomodulin
LFQNSLLPPSQRCRNQTDKEPTGPYQRDKLLKYLEDKAKNEKDWEEIVPFSPGIKRGLILFFKGFFIRNFFYIFFKPRN